MQRELGGSFSGIIDEVRVYDKALTPEVIGTIYQAGKPPSTWYWYVLGVMVVLCGVGCFLYWRGYRIPAKFMNQILKRLPQKISAHLVRFKHLEQEPEMVEAAAPA